MFTAISNHFLEADLIQTKNVRRIIPVPFRESLFDFEPAINLSFPRQSRVDWKVCTAEFCEQRHELVFTANKISDSNTDAQH